MRRRSVAIALVVLITGLTAAVLRRRAGRRTPTSPVVTARVEPVAEYEAVVLPFPPRVSPAPGPAQPAAPVRCGDTGGRTKAGAPCGSRATSQGRCHHHRIAA